MHVSRSSLWLTEDEILAHIASVAGCDPAEARDTYLTRVRSGDLIVEGRPWEVFRRSAWQLIPIADWLNCAWNDLPLSSGFHFGPFVHWYDRRASRQDVEELWPLPAALVAEPPPTPAPARATKPKPGPVPGTIDRYGDADRKLLPDVCRLMRERKCSPTAAAWILAEEGQIAGPASNETKVRRLVKCYHQQASRN
jgi:hypothetical protein